MMEAVDMPHGRRIQELKTMVGNRDVSRLIQGGMIHKTGRGEYFLIIRRSGGSDGGKIQGVRVGR